MKRMVNVLLVAGLALGLSGCGTSKEEEACREQQRQLARSQGLTPNERAVKRACDDDHRSSNYRRHGSSFRGGGSGSGK